MNIDDQVNSIETRDDFVKFVEALAENFDKDPTSWENATIRGYLQALAGWMGDMDGYFMNSRQPVPSKPDWKTIGQMLLAAKHYE